MTTTIWWKLNHETTLILLYSWLCLGATFIDLSGLNKDCWAHPLSLDVTSWAKWYRNIHCCYEVLLNDMNAMSKELTLGRGAWHELICPWNVSGRLRLWFTAVVHTLLQRSIIRLAFASNYAYNAFTNRWKRKIWINKIKIFAKACGGFIRGFNISVRVCAHCTDIQTLFTRKLREIVFAIVIATLDRGKRAVSLNKQAVQGCVRNKDKKATKTEMIRGCDESNSLKLSLTED